MGYVKGSLKLHQQQRGKLSVVPKMSVKTKLGLSMAHMSGVAEACMEIHGDIEKSYELTRRWSTVAVVMDRIAVLELGDMGPEAAMSIMEGECVLFKAFGDVDAIPVCIRSKDVNEVAHTASLLVGSFSGTNLEDIVASHCFEIERRLRECCDIPVSHDDQYGTTIVVMAALDSALKTIEEEIKDIKIVIDGAGSAGTAIARLLLSMGAGQLVLYDRFRVLYEGIDGLDEEQIEIFTVVDPEKKQGSFSDVIAGADVLIGVSVPGVIGQEIIRSMALKTTVFPMASPTPEITPDLVLEAGTAVVGTGRSDFPDQINNMLVLLGISRGVLDARARTANDEMKVVATCALAGLISNDGLRPGYILPEPFDLRIKEAVAKVVVSTAMISGVTQKQFRFP